MRRESYVGPWLPEPILTRPDIADDVVLADSVSTALLLVLETLSPLERAVFVLNEAFGYPYAEIAHFVGRGEPAVRQPAHRARKAVEGNFRLGAWALFFGLAVAALTVNLAYHRDA